MRAWSVPLYVYQESITGPCCSFSRICLAVVLSHEVRSSSDVIVALGILNGWIVGSNNFAAACKAWVKRVGRASQRSFQADNFMAWSVFSTFAVLPTAIFGIPSN